MSSGDFAHFMRKEIAEQPEALARTLSGRLEPRFQTTHLGGIDLAARELLEIRRIKILGCGSAFIAGCIGAQLIEQLARLPAHAEPASEFRYRNPVIESDTLYVAVSQSGETFDTLAAVQEIKRKGGRVLGIVNVVGSTIARECGRGIYLHAGPEVAVVSTKTFTCTAAAFALLAIHLGRIRDLSTAEGGRLLAALAALPEQIASILAREAEIECLAERLVASEHAYFVGRAAGYAVAMEGALKLKEVSYLHAEAYPASELKHGPLALVSPETPTIVIMPRDDLFQKNVSTIEEIRARRGPVLGDHPVGRAAGRGRSRLRGAGSSTRTRSDPAEHPAPAARLPGGAAAELRHRPAAQPGEIGDRRIGRVRAGRHRQNRPDTTGGKPRTCWPR